MVEFIFLSVITLGHRTQKTLLRMLLFLCTRTENLQLTDELIGNLDDRTHNEETSKDIRRIQELLTSPENTNER